MQGGLNLGVKAVLFFSQEVFLSRCCGQLQVGGRTVIWQKGLKEGAGSGDQLEGAEMGQGSREQSTRQT